MMLLKNARLIESGNDLRAMDLLIEDGVIRAMAPVIATRADWTVLDCAGKLLTPGFVDPHVHLREPGFTDKETIATGTRAAIRGGYTTIFAMPNVSPCPDTAERMAGMTARTAASPIEIGFFAPITIGEKGEELTDFQALKQAGAVALSDDGKGVQHSGMMYRAMMLAKANDLVISAHCEDESLLDGGYIHAGDYARANGHKGILRACEDVQVGRDILLAGETGARYHICHMSTFRSVDLLKMGQDWGYHVSGEVSPHHLLLTDADLAEDGRFKMNPPLRAEIDRQRLIRGLREGTIRVIATDHAPHTAEEKSRGLAGSPFGITGLETAFPLIYTELVRPGHLDLETVVRAMTQGPAEVFGLDRGRLEVGARADLTLIDLDSSYVIDASSHESKGTNTPFDGRSVRGAIDTVIKDGRVILAGGRFTE